MKSSGPVTLFLGALMVSATWSAADCPDAVGRWGYGPTGAVAVAGNVVYSGAGSVLVVTDWSAPAAPVVLAELLLPGAIDGLTLAGTRLFVAAAEAGLRIVDVANPAAPVEVGFSPTDWLAQDVAVLGSNALIASSWGGLEVVDVGNVAAPRRIATLDPPGVTGFVSVTASGTTVFAADDDRGVRVIDVSDPEHPALLATLDTPGRAGHVATLGSYLFVADDTQGLRVVDISSPPSPIEVGAVDTPGHAAGVAVVGTRAYVADGNQGLVVVDISNPAAPVLLGATDTAASARRVAVAAGRAFVADEYGGVRAFDVGAVPPVGIGAQAGIGWTVDVALAGDHAYLADEHTGLRVIDVGDPSAPVEVGSLALTGARLAVAMAGNVVLTERASRLAVIDVSVPATPVLRGSTAVVGDIADIEVAGTIAYLVVGGSGLVVADFSAPNSPSVVGSIDTPGDALAVAAAGSMVYVADGEEGLRVIDVSVPSHPVEVGVAATTDSARGVAVSGHLVLVADRNGGLRVFDASVPSTPVEVGAFDPGPTTSEVVVSGHYAFTDCDGITVLDIADPANPVQVRRIEHPSGSAALILVGTTLLSADEGLGFSIFDVGQCLESPEVTVLVGASGIADGQPAAVSFGTVVQGSAGASRTFTVRNDGGGLLTLGAVAVPAGYTVTEELPANLAAGQADSFTIRLDAASTGTKSGQISFVTGDADESPFNFAVTGKVNPPPPRRFDFGTAASPVAPGYARVTNASAYSPALGYGWVSGAVASRDRATGGDLNRDFNFTPQGTFAVDIPGGAWDVTLTLGDASAVHDQMGVYLEGVLAGTHSTVAGQFTTRSYRTTVADGQLTVLLDDLGGRDPNVVVTAMVVTPPWPRKFDFGTASSPVQQSYTRVTHASAYASAVGFGWSGGTVGSRDRASGDDLGRDFNFTTGATFSVDLPNGTYQVSGQSGDASAGHDQMRVSMEGEEVDVVTTLPGVWYTWFWTVVVTDTQLSVGLSDGGGSDANVVINSLEIVPASLWYDFGTATSPPANGYRPVAPTTVYSQATGFGWLSGTISARDRGTADTLRRDFNFTADGTFAVDVPNGPFDVRVIMGDATTAHDHMGVFLEGVLLGSFSSAAGQYLGQAFHGVNVLDGQLTLRLDDLGGPDPNVVICGLELSPAGSL